MTIRAVIFDLDGVLTDTSEYHYKAWQRLAGEENLPFNRQINDRLRGVSRQRSLEIILNGRSIPPTKFSELTERKNRYYVESLQEISANNLLPGALTILQTLKDRNVKLAVGSASKNARFVLERLDIIRYFYVVADGRSVAQTKPSPDLFLFAAQQMNIPPAQCVVVEDAASGIEAALAAGMWQAVVFGFAGLTLEPEGYHFSPRLPAHWNRLAFALQLRGQDLWIEIQPDKPVGIKQRVKQK